MPLFKAISTSWRNGCFIITFNRLEQKNAINRQMLGEINTALDDASQMENPPLIILEGSSGVFSYGMDLNEAMDDQLSILDSHGNDKTYFETLERMTQHPSIVIARVDGRVLGGGVGVIAACDMVIATRKSVLGLPEIKHGLLPANVAPFLVRKIGYQAAYRLALTGKTIKATDAHRMGLIDILSEELDSVIDQLKQFIDQIPPKSALRLKRYFNRLYPIGSVMQTMAEESIRDCLSDQETLTEIKQFLQNRTDTV